MLPGQDKLRSALQPRPVTAARGSWGAPGAGDVAGIIDAPPPAVLSRPAVQLAFVLAVCALVYWPLLGRSGLAFTEGHRVVPAWAMLETGDFLVPRLFERVYLRKPPGASWAIAVSSSFLGRTEFAARSVSALAMTASCLFAVFMARRWFGPRAGLSAGLAQGLAPLWWSTGRSAEIEALNNLGTQVAVLLLLDLLIRRPRRPVAVACAAGAGAGAILAGIAKGPTSLPCVAGVLIGAGAAVGSVRVLLRRELAIAVALPLLVLGALGAAIYARLNGDEQPAVTQSIADFLWRPGTAGEVLTLVPVALLSALPVSLALLFPWGKEARAEYAGLPPHQSPFVIARALALTCLSSLLLLALLGVGNPRHAMPALACISPLVGYAIAGLGTDFTPRRTRDGRVMLLGRAWVWPVVLTIVAVCFVFWSEARRQRISGQSAGVAIGELLPDGCELWADGAIEARPEVAAYAARRAAQLGRSVRPRWIALSGQPLPPAGGPRTFLLLRADELGDEAGAYARHEPGRLNQVGTWAVYKYRFCLVEVVGSTP